jgi:DNA-binding Lrp family transcriptional regulator
MQQDILKLLENDARLSAKQLSEMTGVPAAEVSKQLKKAEKDRVILKYKTVVNWDKAGDDSVWGMIEVRVSPQSNVGFDAIAEHIYRFPETRTVYLVSGTYDLMLLVVCKTLKEVGEFISENVATIDGVQGTVTHFVLKRYKEDGEIIEGNPVVKRQPVIL